ncbi:MAG: sulfite exporter TauE/SafE family protein [Planctomycetia bacterium]|nr:sulfite exporter TauE/SafE family protein [Planctomycetia bacterium]
MSLSELITPITLLIGYLAAILIGVSKTGVPGVGLFACLLMISAFSGHEMFASGAVVPLLILGDVAAVWYYRRDCDPKLLKRLWPPVAIGLLLGATLLCFMLNSHFKITVGALASSILIFEFIRKACGWTKVSTNPYFRRACGVLAGCSTILGNAAGAVSAAYFSSQGLDKKSFMGTNAVFFFGVNVAKIPLMILVTAVKSHLGFDVNDSQIMNLTTFCLTLIFAPGIIIGGVIGRSVYNKIPEKIFVPFILILNFITAIYILISAF